MGIFLRKLWAVPTCVLLCLATNLVQADSLKKLEDNINFGIQYRVMYNNSNLGSMNQYDFFRQRLRLNVDVHTEANVGGFIQVEFRGGWGGSAPVSSDPRGGYAINAFNRLQARGIRYGYLYFAPAENSKIMAGILPLNDGVDQMLFSADWDLNIGGVAWTGGTDKVDYRVAYVRLVEGVAFRNDNDIKDKDEHFLVGDVTGKFEGGEVGGHFYGLYGKVISGGELFKLSHTWIGGHANLKAGENVGLHGVFLYNTGKFAPDTADVNNSNGWLARVEASATLGKANLGVLGVYSSGDKDGQGFQTVHSILGTGGYWAYTYIFTPHGPSDVNDYGLEPGNGGFGLTTVQAKVDVPLNDKFSFQGVAAFFQSNEDIAISNNQTSSDIGTEFGVQFTAKVGKNMNFEFGGAIANLGDAGKVVFQGTDDSTVNEIFGRLQLEF